MLSSILAGAPYDERSHDHTPDGLFYSSSMRRPSLFALLPLFAFTRYGISVLCVFGLFIAIIVNVPRSSSASLNEPIAVTPLLAYACQLRVVFEAAELLLCPAVPGSSALTAEAFCLVCPHFGCPRKAHLRTARMAPRR